MDTTSPYYFSAHLLRDMLGVQGKLKATGMQTEMQARWGLTVKRGAIEGWLARDHVPGWVVAQIMFSEPEFPVSRLIARRVPHVPAPAASPAVEDLLS